MKLSPASACGNGICEQHGCVWTDFVTGDRFVSVGSWQKARHFGVEPRLVLRQPGELRVNAPMGFRHVSGLLQGQRLRGVKCGKVGRPASGFGEPNARDRAGFFEGLPRLV
jgi:hypothetical protein